MAGKNVKGRIVLPVGFDITDGMAAVQDLKVALGAIGAPKSLGNKFNKEIDIAIDAYKKLEKYQKKGTVNETELQEANRLYLILNKTMQSIGQNMNSIDVSKLVPPGMAQQYKTLVSEVDKYNKGLEAATQLQASLTHATLQQSKAVKELATKKKVDVDDPKNTQRITDMIREQITLLQEKAALQKKAAEAQKEAVDPNIDLVAIQTEAERVYKDNLRSGGGFKRNDNAKKELAAVFDNVPNIWEVIEAKAKAGGGFKDSSIRTILDSIFTDLPTIELQFDIGQDAKTKLTDLTNVVGQVDSIALSAQPNLNSLASKLTAAEQAAAQFYASMGVDAQKSVALAKQMFADYGGAIDTLGDDIKDSQEKMDYEASIKQTTANVQSKIKQLLGFGAILTQVSRMIKQAVSQVKELDAAMTQISVVTTFTNAQLWQQIDAYMAIAEQYGVTTTGVYQVSQLYYQQGLNTKEVMEMTTETLKMAKIAGLDYAAATDYMTVAIRGFKLDVEDAGHVVDVYSKLAAIAATDTRELAVAMSKTASIAESAGMSIESTSSFLTLMIETTREAPENLGTAMKTIIARFQEMKKSPLELVEVDGEQASLNKVDKALKTIGISLTDASGQFRDLDDVIFELSEGWDGLDRNTQRYIATTVAGSRQQSRFLALMSDNTRLVELYTQSLDSEDAALLQYAKTLDSIESKINQLSTSFQQFYMSILNGPAIAGVVDIFKTLLNTLNEIPKALAIPGLIAGILGLGAALKGVLHSYQILMGTATAKSVGFFATIKTGFNLAAASAKSFGATMLVALNWIGLIAIVATTAIAIFNKMHKSVTELNAELETLKIKAAQDAKDYKDLINYEKEWTKAKTEKDNGLDERQKWLDLNNELALLYPQLVSQITDEGDRIVDLTKYYEDLRKEKEANALLSAKEKYDKLIERDSEEGKLPRSHQSIDAVTKERTQLTEYYQKFLRLESEGGDGIQSDEVRGVIHIKITEEADKKEFKEMYANVDDEVSMGYDYLAANDGSDQYVVSLPDLVKQLEELQNIESAFNKSLISSETGLRDYTEAYLKISLLNDKNNFMLESVSDLVQQPQFALQTAQTFLKQQKDIAETDDSSATFLSYLQSNKDVMAIYIDTYYNSLKDELTNIDEKTIALLDKDINDLSISDVNAVLTDTTIVLGAITKEIVLGLSNNITETIQAFKNQLLTNDYGDDSTDTPALSESMNDVYDLLSVGLAERLTKQGVAIAQLDNKNPNKNILKKQFTDLIESSTTNGVFTESDELLLNTYANLEDPTSWFGVQDYLEELSRLVDNELVDKGKLAELITTTKVSFQRMELSMADVATAMELWTAGVEKGLKAWKGGGAHSFTEIFDLTNSGLGFSLDDFDSSTLKYTGDATQPGTEGMKGFIDKFIPKEILEFINNPANYPSAADAKEAIEEWNVAMRAWYDQQVEAFDKQQLENAISNLSSGIITQADYDVLFGKYPDIINEGIKSATNAAGDIIVANVLSLREKIARETMRGAERLTELSKIQELREKNSKILAELQGKDSLGTLSKSEELLLSSYRADKSFEYDNDAYLAELEKIYQENIDIVYKSIESMITDFGSFAKKLKSGKLDDAQWEFLNIGEGDRAEYQKNTDALLKIGAEEIFEKFGVNLYNYDVYIKSSYKGLQDLAQLNAQVAAAEELSKTNQLKAIAQMSQYYSAMNDIILSPDSYDYMGGLYKDDLDPMYKLIENTSLSKKALAEAKKSNKIGNQDLRKMLNWGQDNIDKEQYNKLKDISTSLSEELEVAINQEQIKTLTEALDKTNRDAVDDYNREVMFNNDFIDKLDQSLNAALTKDGSSINYLEGEYKTIGALGEMVKETASEADVQKALAIAADLVAKGMDIGPAFVAGLREMGILKDDILLSNIDGNVATIVDSLKLLDNLTTLIDILKNSPTEDPTTPKTSAEYQELFESSSSDIALLEHQLKNEKTKLSVLEDKMAATDTAHTAELEKLYGEIESRKLVIDTKEKELAALEDTIALHAKELSEISSELSAAQKAHSESTKLYDQKIETSQAEVLAIQTQLESLNDQYETAKSEATLQASLAETARKDAEVLTAIIDELKLSNESSLDAEKSKASTAEIEKKAALDAQAIAEGRAAFFENEAKEAKNKIAELEAKLLTARGDAVDELIEMASREKELKQQLKTSEDVVATLKSTISSHEAEIEILKTQINEIIANMNPVSDKKPPTAEEKPASKQDKDQGGGLRKDSSRSEKDFNTTNDPKIWIEQETDTSETKKEIISELTDPPLIAPITTDVVYGPAHIKLKKWLAAYLEKKVYIKYELPTIDLTGPKMRGNSNDTSTNQTMATGGLAIGGKTLVGELGPELRVSDGRYSVVGNGGAEFVNLSRGDMIFNHLQTARLLKGQKGGTGRALASGTGPAMAQTTKNANTTNKSLFGSYKTDTVNVTFEDTTGKKTKEKTEEQKEYNIELEKWFNWLQRIAQINNRINILQAQRANITTDGSAYTKSLAEENAYLTAQNVITQDLINNQIADRKRLQASMGAMSEYFSFYGDALVLNYPAIESATKYNEELGSTITDLISEYTTVNDLVSANTVIYQNNLTTIANNLRDLRDKTIEMEEEVLSALQAMYQKEIEARQKVVDEKIKANEKYITALRKSLEQERNLYDKNSALEDKSRLERKLAMLEKDVSGSNMKEIASLREELRKIASDEYFQKREESIDDLEEGLATETTTMQSEVDLLITANQAKLDNMELYWAEVTSIINQGTEATLDFLTSWSDAYSKMSQTQQEDYVEQWQLTITAAEGYSARLNQINQEIMAAADAQAALIAKPPDASTSTPGPSDSGEGGSSDGSAGGSGKTNKTSGGSKQWGIYIDGVRVKSSYGSEAKALAGIASTLAQVQTVYNNLKTAVQNETDPRIKTMNADRLREASIELNRYKRATVKAYSKGGLADYTGLAMVHGSKSEPESFFDAKATKALIDFTKVLKGQMMASMSNGYTIPASAGALGGGNSGDTTINIEVKAGVVNNSTQANSLADEIYDRFVKVASKSTSIKVFRT